MKYYKKEFKLKAIQKYKKGIKPETIIQEVEDLSKHNIYYAKNLLKRWTKLYDKYGSKAFIGIGKNTKKVLSKNWEKEIEKLSDKEKLKWMKAKIALLEQESILFLRLRKEEKLKKHNIFKIIFKAKEKYKDIELNKLFVISNVSKSGYYDWLKKKEEREWKDYLTFLMINKIFIDSKKTKGYRSIAMDLKINHKKIQRIMQKYALKAKIRKKRFKHSFEKEVKSFCGSRINKVKNILNREFKQKSLFTFLSTDITYLYYGKNKVAYLSVIKDIASGEIIAFHLSEKMNLKLVMKTLDKLIINLKRKKINLKNILLHSDQGFQYTSLDYHNRLKEMKITQSMSRKGNSIDNAIIETFFGHLKDEIDFKIIDNFFELKNIINNYVLRYNYKRPQWNKKKMTPVEYRNHLLNLSL